MLVSVINNSYSALQTLSRWYWSVPTQQRLISTAQTLAEVLTITLLVLSQAYSDSVALLDTWLTPGCYNVFVITPEEGNTGWLDVWAMLLGDASYAQTWLGYTAHDFSNAATELYYRIRAVLT